MAKIIQRSMDTTSNIVIFIHVSQLFNNNDNTTTTNNTNNKLYDIFKFIFH